MSASLVGSEMCIRDSACTFACVRTSACAGARARAPVSVSAHACAARARAVSYTHLTLPTICSV
eukprot:14409967-Alexandrium_andersonii.AAC.1